MIEPTITQNCALYLAQHKVAKQRAGFLRRFRLPNVSRRSRRLITGTERRV